MLKKLAGSSLIAIVLLLGTAVQGEEKTSAEKKMKEAASKAESTVKEAATKAESKAKEMMSEAKTGKKVVVKKKVSKMQENKPLIFKLGIVALIIAGCYVIYKMGRKRTGKEEASTSDGQQE